MNGHVDVVLRLLNSRADLRLANQVPTMNHYVFRDDIVFTLDSNFPTS